MMAGVIGFVLGLAVLLLAIAALIACAVLWSALMFGGYRALFALFTRRKPRHDASDQHFGGDCFPHPVMRGDFKSSSHVGGGKRG